MARPTSAPRARANVSIFILPSGRERPDVLLSGRSLLRGRPDPTSSPRATRPPRFDGRVEDRLRAQRDPELGLACEVFGCEAGPRLVDRDDDGRDPRQIDADLARGGLRRGAEPSRGQVI